MGKAKNKKASPAPVTAADPEPKVVPSTSPDNYDSDVEFEEIQETLQKSLSHDYLTWMRKVIRVQAEDILKARLKQEFENEFNNRMSLQIGNLKKKVGDLEQEVDNLKSENTKRKRQIERLEYSNSKKQSEIDKLRMKIDEFEQDKFSESVQIVGLPENKDESEDVRELSFFTGRGGPSVCDCWSPIFSGPPLGLRQKILVPPLDLVKKFWSPPPRWKNIPLA